MALGEYRFGLQASRQRMTCESKLQELEQRFKVLPVDRATATFYASIRRHLKSNGTPIPWHDVWIAAQAKQHDVRILSNDAHFDYVDPDLRVGW